jgi:hypothetical protein
MMRKISWRSLKFIPEGGDESQAITRRDKGFMHLCELWRYEPTKLSGYQISDIHGMFAKYGYNNVTESWSDFREALSRYKMKKPPEKPSVFQGEWFPPEHTIRMRKRLLAAALREYISAESLAEDLLEWMARGKVEDIRRFVIAILCGVGWLKDIPQTPDAALAKPIQEPPKDQV